MRDAALARRALVIAANLDGVDRLLALGHVAEARSMVGACASQLREAAQPRPDSMVAIVPVPPIQPEPF